MQIEHLFLCNKKEIRVDDTPDCISALIKDQSCHCLRIPVEMSKFLIKLIMDQFILNIAENKTKIMTKCPDEEVSFRTSLKIQYPKALANP